MGGDSKPYDMIARPHWSYRFNRRIMIQTDIAALRRKDFVRISLVSLSVVALLLVVAYSGIYALGSYRHRTSSEIELYTWMKWYLADPEIVLFRQIKSRKITRIERVVAATYCITRVTDVCT